MAHIQVWFIHNDLKNKIYVKYEHLQGAYYARMWKQYMYNQLPRAWILMSKRPFSIFSGEASKANITLSKKRKAN